MNCEVRTITPKEAKELLQTNCKNRPVNKAHVTFFEEQLKRGEMQLTHQGIALSKNGRLLDGQHRLMAIVNTGISATVLIASNLDEKVFTVLDTGAKRTAGDILAINGATDSNSLAAGVKLYILYRKIPHLVWTGNRATFNASASTIKNEFDSDPENWSWAASMAQNYALAKILAPGPMACVAYMAHQKCNFSRDFITKFCSQLKSGASLPTGHPILAYRNKVFASSATQTQQTRLADYIKLFNAYATSQQLKIFKAQAFPPMPTLVEAAESVGVEIPVF